MALFDTLGIRDPRKTLAEGFARKVEEAASGGKKGGDKREPEKPPQKAKGGKVTKVAGKPVGRDDGLIAAQKGEHVIKRASAQKYGDRKMAAVNRGTAKVTMPKGSKR
ncbi:MAG TPA: hypothetical protein VNU68_34930 [Verrucomicrobiae bacterium]|nr:hypothetical protein [Verrucomicrobiae bacterium]